MIQRGKVIDIEDDDEDDDEDKELKKLEKEKEKLEELLKKTKDAIHERKKMKMNEKEKEELKKHNLSRLVERYEVLNVNNNNNENERIRQEQLGMNVGNVKKHKKKNIIAFSYYESQHIYVFNEIKRGIESAYLFVKSSFAFVVLPDDKIVIFGGKDREGSSKDCQVFDFKNKQLTQINDMITPREAASAILLPNGLVFIVGGFSGIDATNSCEFYDPIKGIFLPSKAIMSIERVNPAISLLPDGKVIVCGGFDGSNSLKSTEIYDPLTDSFISGPDMNFERDFCGATLLSNGNVFVCGGNKRSAEILVTKEQKFVKVAEMIKERSGVFVCLLSDGNVFISSNRRYEIYDPEKDEYFMETEKKQSQE